MNIQNPQTQITPPKAWQPEIFPDPRVPSPGSPGTPDTRQPKPEPSPSPDGRPYDSPVSPLTSGPDYFPDNNPFWEDGHNPLSSKGN